MGEEHEIYCLEGLLIEWLAWSDSGHTLGVCHLGTIFRSDIHVICLHNSLKANTAHFEQSKMIKMLQSALRQNSDTAVHGIMLGMKSNASHCLVPKSDWYLSSSNFLSYCNAAPYIYFRQSSFWLLSAQDLALSICTELDSRVSEMDMTDLGTEFSSTPHLVLFSCLKGEPWTPEELC